jgi:hypothetical protein
MIVHTTCVIPHKDGTEGEYSVTADVSTVESSGGYHVVEVGEPEIEHSTGVPVEFDPFSRDSPFEPGWSLVVEDALTEVYLELCSEPLDEEY